MKHLIRLSFVLFTVLMLSCGKSSTVNKITENPIAALFADTVLSDTSKNGLSKNQGSFPEFGYEFSVTKAGNVTQLGCKIPDNGTVRVTLWQLEDTVSIAQLNITVDSGVVKYSNLTSPVALVVGKMYAISVMSKDLYFQNRHTGDPVDYPYPITKGNVVISKYGYTYSVTPDPLIYLSTFPTTFLAGFMDFTYETMQ